MSEVRIRWWLLAVMAVVVAGLSLALHTFVVGPLVPDPGMNILLAVIDGFLIGVLGGLCCLPWIFRD